MAQKRYTQGEAVSFAGRLLARYFELVGLAFYLLAKVFAYICRGIFRGVGLLMDGYENVQDISFRQIHPELRLKMKEVVLLATKEASLGWEWVDEAVQPIKQVLAINQAAFRERTMKKDEIIRKDCEAILMARFLNKVVLETTFANSQFKPLAWMKGRSTPRNIYNEELKEGAAADIKEVLREGVLKYIAGLRGLTTRCDVDPVRKSGLLVRYSVLSLKYHSTGMRRYQKNMLKIEDNMNDSICLEDTKEVQNV